MEFIAKKVANWCNQINPKTEDEQAVLQYGVQVFLDDAVKLTGLLILALLFHKGPETFLVLGSFGWLRVYAGGIHMNTGIACFLSMFAIAATGVLLQEVKIPLGIVAFMVLFCIISIWKYAPCDSKNTPIINESIRNKKRFMSRAIVLAICVTALLFPGIRNLLLVSAVYEALTILPIVNHINYKRMEV